MKFNLINNLSKFLKYTTMVSVVLSSLTFQAKVEASSSSDGKWMTGEYHIHTVQSNDVSEEFMNIENILNVAFREDMDILPKESKTDNIKYGSSFDYIMLADHLRNSPRDVSGVEKITARWEAIAEQQEEIEKLKAEGKYDGKIVYSGFEWDMMGLDHASVGIIGEDGEVPFDGIHQFEWLFSYDTKDEVFTNNEKTLYGERQNDKNKVEDTYSAIEWLSKNYPNSFVLPNHPSRHNNGDDVVDLGEVAIEHLRKLNDIDENIVFGFEGMPGNQMAGEGSCELPPDDIRAGADEMISVTGGVWDALLSEGRHFYNFANSDFHFKISTNKKYGSGYWPSEFSRNYTWVEAGEDGVYTFEDVVNGMRSGNSYSVNGELISDLQFTVNKADSVATMGQELEVSKDDNVTVNIRFKVPQNNNYQSIYNNNTGLNATNTPKLHHVDLIMGHVTGKVDEANYNSTENTDAKIVKTFDLSKFKVDSEGYYNLTYTTKADDNMYFRIRGTSSNLVDENGDPVTHEREVAISTQFRHDQINDYNYTHLSFYANPIWVNVVESK